MNKLAITTIAMLVNTCSMAPIPVLGAPYPYTTFQGNPVRNGIVYPPNSVPFLAPTYVDNASPTEIARRETERQKIIPPITPEFALQLKQHSMECMQDAEASIQHMRALGFAPTSKDFADLTSHCG